MLDEKITMREIKRLIDLYGSEFVNKFSKDQLWEIYDFGPYNSYDSTQEQLRKVDERVFEFARPEYSPARMQYIKRALKENIPTYPLLDNELTDFAVECLFTSLSLNLDISGYARGYTGSQIDIISLAQTEGLDIAHMLNPAFDVDQLQIIRMGLRDGLPAHEYALPDLDAEKMQQVYLNMYNGEKYSHLLPKKEIPGEKQSFFATLKSFFSGSKSQETLVNEQLMIENQNDEYVQEKLKTINTLRAKIASNAFAAAEVHKLVNDETLLVTIDDYVRSLRDDSSRAVYAHKFLNVCMPSLERLTRIYKDLSTKSMQEATSNETKEELLESIKTTCQMIKDDYVAYNQHVLLDATYEIEYIKQKSKEN